MTFEETFYFKAYLYRELAEELAEKPDTPLADILSELAAKAERALAAQRP